MSDPRDPSQWSPVIRALLKEAAEEWPRVRAMMLRRYRHQGRQPLREFELSPEADLAARDKPDPPR